MKYLWPVIAITMFSGVVTPSFAQIEKHTKSLDYCVRDMNLNMDNYAPTKGLDKGIGAYQFDVRTLFDMGVCTGQKPANRSTDWNLCNFRGLVAIDNNIFNKNDFLLANDVQDKIMIELIKKNARDFAQLAKDKLPQENAAYLLSALAYKRGKKAVELYAYTDINAIDGRGRSMRDYWHFMKSCAGDKLPPYMKPSRSYHADRNYKMKLPIDFNWKVLNSETLKKQLDSFEKKPEELVSYLQDNKANNISFSSVDLNGNGIPDYQYQFSDPYYCGERYCLYILIEDMGKAIYRSSFAKVRPAPYGLYVSGFYNEIYE
jgi:hypothetical protein